MTSPRVAPGLLSWPAWQALRSASSVLVPAGHPQLPALDEAGIGYRVVDDADVELLAVNGVAVWLPEPGAEPPLPPGAQLLRGSADLPGARFLDLVATILARLDGGAHGSADGAADGEDIGGELFRLVARARELGIDPEFELRAAARRYRDLVHAWERS